MSNNLSHIENYNKNVYINILKVIHGRLHEVETFLKKIGENNNFRSIDNLVTYYSDIFTTESISAHIDFKIERIYKALYLTTPGPHDKGNSYFHLTLTLHSSDILWLDNLYDKILSKLIKFYKHLFSKIDNYFITFNGDQLEKYKGILSDIKNEVEKFLKFSEHRDLVAKRRKLDAEKLNKIPFGGLFYTAHLNNIKSILEFGILSHNLVYQQGIANVDISNQQVNARRNRVESSLGGNIHDFAPLYFNPKNPMLYVLCMNGKREDLILLKINPHILLVDNVAFSDGNAAVQTTTFYKNIEDFNKLNWTIIKDNYWTNYPDGKRIKCSEVLVYQKIPVYYITDLFVYNESTLNKILPLFPNHLGIESNINKQLYF